MESDFVSLILDFIEEAGKVALEYRDELSSSIKDDGSIVTNADLKISELFHKKIEKYLNLGNHKILDEENLPDIKEFFSNRSEYLWTIDPIDGTTTYFSGFPLWAVAISLYKDFKPYIGAIYMPAVGELVYTDGEKSYYVRDAFKPNEKKRVLNLDNKKLSKESVILQHRLKDFDYETNSIVLDLYSSYVVAFYTLSGSAICTFLNKPMKLWDVTSTLPIAKNLGMFARNIDTDEYITQLTSDLVDDDWRLKDRYLLCQESCYDEIIEKLAIKKRK
jgi:fructose-1,6-bisphosphatase/inositol monophosphatase family enzyme